MAKAYITEYTGMVRDVSGNLVPVGREPSEASQVVTFTTSAQSAPFSAKTRYVRVICEVKAHFAVGTNPTATADSHYMPADSPEYFGLSSDGGLRIAFYDGTS